MDLLKKTDVKTLSEAMQISHIAIDTYDDLFSDFDPSHYDTRILSEDFLHELHHRYSENKKGEFSIRISLPKALRSEKTESIVKRRFKDYFKKELKHLQKSEREKKYNGILRVIGGILLSALLIIFPELDTVPILTIFSVLIWYFLWSGFEHIFELSKHSEHRTRFFEKFIRAEFTFVSEEDLLQLMQKLRESAPEQKKIEQKSEFVKQEQKKEPLVKLAAEQKSQAVTSEQKSQGSY
jgi:hypothetical protein